MQRRLPGWIVSRPRRPGAVVAQMAVALFAAVAWAPPARAQEAASYVAEQDGPGRFALFAGGRAAPIHVSPGDHAGVRRAAADLRLDVGRVAGAQPELVEGDAAPSARQVLLVGTLGRSPIIDRLVAERRLDVSRVAGRWETYLVQSVERPLPGVDRALVIAGSDKRGTIFGIYDLSAEMGVSPWHYWADVPARRRSAVYVLPGAHTDGEPAVRYRGIFINDEAPALAGWAEHTFGGFNSRFYAQVFELVLRLKGNYLWPAMWGRSIYDDDPLSGPLADEYGVVLGTSHHEPMSRAHVEWARHGSGPWDYTRNADTLRAFWREGIRRMGGNESIVTLGMRGDGDEAMTEGTATELLERIVADQRTILGEVTGRDPAATPQVWALYKEVQDYYDAGMRVPEDVTLLFADDNWGNIRRLPALGAERPGGYGVYYHFDYVGGPRNYKWLNNTQIERVWEQMGLAHRYGADRIWIVNVGDIKPMEFPISFFLDYAWNPGAWPAERLPEYSRRWAAQQFGAERAAEVGRVLDEYSRLSARRKPELLDTATYSLANFREAERVMDEWTRLRQEAERLNAALPAGHRDAYFQLVLHPVQAMANLHDLYITAARNRLYARQERAATNALADRVRTLFARDAEISRQYNEGIANGKWRHMMDQTHIGYTYWQQPPRNVMPRVDVIHVPSPAELGVAIEGSLRMVGFGRDSAVLPTMDVYNQQRRYVEVFNRGATPFEYRVEAEGAPWLQLSPAAGRVTDETRVWVSVDWGQAPEGRHRVPIRVSGPDSARYTVYADVFKPATPRREAVRGFVESGGFVAMEAEHHSRAVGRWQRIPNLGRTLSAMTPLPITMPRQRPGGSAPHLEYRIHTFSAGEVQLHAYLSPSLAFNGSDGLRYAVSIDGEAPQIVNMHADRAHIADNGNRAWENMVAENIKVVTTRHRIAAPGEHVVRFWAVDPGVVLQKLVVQTGPDRPSYLGPPESFRGGR